MTTYRYRNEIFHYEILWRASQTAIDMAKIENEIIRPDHLAIYSLLTGFLAFEGFLNFVGEEIAEEAWKKEKGFFSGNEYKGVVGKIDYLFSKFPGTELKKGEEPYQTFSKIKQIRDILAHNRVRRYEECSVSENPSFEPSWKNFDTPEKVKPYLERLKELAESIRGEAKKLLVEDYELSHLHFPAFTGPIGNAEGDGID